MQEKDLYVQNVHYSKICTEIGHKTKFNVIITTFENGCVSKKSVIVMIPILNPTYKEKKQVQAYI